MIAERLTRAVKLRLGGAEWPITITHDILLGLEAETGADVLGGELDVWRPSAISLRALLFLALRGSGAPWDRSTVCGMVTPSTIPAIHAVLMDAWTAAMPLPETNPAPVERKVKWIDAYAMARIDLGLAEAEWLAMTPCVVQALFRRRFEGMKREEALHGIVADKKSAPPAERNLTGEDIVAAMGGKMYLKG